MITTTHNRQTVAVKRRATTIPERRRPEGASEASHSDDADSAQSAGRATASERGGVPHKVRHIVIN